MAVVVFPDSIMYANSARIAGFAADSRLPAISGWGSLARNGFPLTYGPNLRDLYRILARYVGHVLRGANPGEIHVELPRNVQLVINARTAQNLGITIPQSLLRRADEVIR